MLNKPMLLFYNEPYVDPTLPIYVNNPSGLSHSIPSRAEPGKRVSVNLGGVPSVGKDAEVWVNGSKANWSYFYMPNEPANVDIRLFSISTYAISLSNIGGGSLTVTIRGNKGSGGTYSNFYSEYITMRSGETFSLSWNSPDGMVFRYRSNLTSVGSSYKPTYEYNNVYLEWDWA